MKWTKSNPLRIAILDDHVLIRNGFAARLAQEPDFRVLALFENSRELLTTLPILAVDLVVLDYSLQQDELDGLNLIRLTTTRFPALRVLVSSASESPATISLSLRAGAHGFIGKSQDLNELVHAIRVVASHHTYVDQAIAFELGHVPGHQPEEHPRLDSASTLLSNPQLSRREQEVVRHCLEGMLVSEIALKLSRSQKTISTQKLSAFRKLGIRNDIELFKIRNELEAQH